MKKIVYIFIFVLQTVLVFSQNYAPKKFYLVDSLNLSSLNKTDRLLIDSCLTIFHNAKEDTSMVNALSSICENMMHEDWEKYQFFQYNLITITLKNHHSSLVAQHLKKSLAGAINNIGLINSNKGNLSQALMYYQKAKKLQEEIGDKQATSTILNNIGFIFKNQGDIPVALEYYHKALKLREEIGDKNGIAQSLNNMGFIYSSQDVNSKALEYFTKALQLQEEIGDKQGVARSLNNIGAIYKSQEAFSKALICYQKSLKIQEEIGDKQGIAISLNNIGVIYLNQNSLQKALKYFHESIKIQEEIGDQQGVSYSLNNVASIELKLNKLTSATNYGNRSLAIAREIGYPANLKGAAEILKEIYKKQNKYKAAFEMYELEIQMRDSINNEQTKKASIQKQFQYEYEKKAAADSVVFAKENEIKEVEIARQKAEIKVKQNQQMALYGGLLLVLVFAGFMFNRFIVTQKQKTLIEQQKTVVEKAHVLLEEKNSEIIASIRYAKRIQDALMTSQKYIERNIERLKPTTKT